MRSYVARADIFLEAKWTLPGDLRIVSMSRQFMSNPFWAGVILLIRFLAGLESAYIWSKISDDMSPIISLVL
jgi:hypothetical protein